MSTTHHLVIEVETEGSEAMVDLEQLELHCLEVLRGANRLPNTSTMLKFNTVVYETSYPTPNPQEL
jgi:hypothetical protein